MNHLAMLQDLHERITRLEAKRSLSNDDSATIDNLCHRTQRVSLHPPSEWIPHSSASVHVIPPARLQAASEIVHELRKRYLYLTQHLRDGESVRITLLTKLVAISRKNYTLIVTGWDADASLMIDITSNQVTLHTQHGIYQYNNTFP